LENKTLLKLGSRLALNTLLADHKLIELQALTPEKEVEVELAGLEVMQITM
jgi:hypothetical protein